MKNSKVFQFFLEIRISLPRLKVEIDEPSEPLDVRDSKVLFVSQLQSRASCCKGNHRCADPPKATKDPP